VPKLTPFAIAALLLAAGCGGSQRSAVAQELADSPRTYLHYRDRGWWGRDVRISVARLRVWRDVATARVLVSPAADPLDTQRIALRRSGGRWRIVASSDGLVRGPRSTRAATAVERRAIVADASRRIFQGHDRCVSYGIAVSRLDERYAVVGYDFRKPYADCLLGNGESLYRRDADGAWRELSEASDGWACLAAPPGVIRSLDGSCWLARR
jgi:hypothetical protein